MNQSNRKWNLTVLLVFALMIVLPSASKAEAPADGAVSAVAFATLERKADVLRLQIDVSAEAKDLKEALAGLKSLEQADKEKLLKLGASEASIQFSDAQIGMSGDQRQQQMEQMVRMRSGRGRTPTTGPARQSVSVSTTLKAEWPLKGATGDDLLVESNDLQAKVKESNLAATVKPNRTPEEEEAAEEAAGMNQNGEPNPHEPVFVFVAKVSNEDRAKTMAEAFKNAKADAERLAQAAGAGLGGIRQINSSSGPELDVNRYGGYSEFAATPYQHYVFNMFQAMQRGEPINAEEAIGAQPGKVTYRVMVTVSFSIK